MNNKSLSMIDMKLKDAIKLCMFKLSKIYPEDNVQPEDDLYRYLCQLVEQNGNQKDDLQFFLEYCRGTT